ncbi:5,10-methenyltetrahydrofolate synthetase [Schinkia azotoformans MEV2011]|uniref:5-formyltetrahydrofolate cyclo-ligase n=1 Tax=Schinkia azotoformans MEV2011 TaxID=1348973 RepID=A0A072NP92_SCHAZ|nr:5-formyltetrahydrofolate cyclo-ligase [Schinkia azotoformans]KEF38718.1 5,10-methenyltetrahydrofolate synthetase [Schinkia azotoformans MEV2011]MEC1697053.1 5-formyltetrahydrofolate cyclo-ligase [Schinkia azotoformans]MEC1718092.1 5-formyltetrahydrofolate cyclo-ligase [Schinkia azotoformans]MEC1727066.1 5-formyltetrahydrofolate cyclo-ligase [Schinkia azotoformans]MEC1743549.1 5-formyltetrahydrofolate cyclo-ligase [Schinkia azotoformans]
MDKRQIRKDIKEKLQAVPPDVLKKWSSNIAANLFNTDDWKQADTIAITISRGTEVDTKAIIEKGWEERKQMVVPKCEPATKGMTFRVLESFDQLEVVYYGLLEPKENETKAVSPSKIKLIVVPGLGFNQNGYRVGFGGGYYDRFLSEYNGRKAALAFQEVQLVDELPIEEHDVPVNLIVTNEQVILCR